MKAQGKQLKYVECSALKRIILAQINDFLIPLSPLAEQQRIVTKIKELFAQLDFITTTLTEQFWFDGCMEKRSKYY